MNKRLNALAEMVDKGSRVADIGTDHAYLPIELMNENMVSYAIASDIAAGPLQNAKDDIVAAGFEDKIETRLGAGLSTITKTDKIDTVVIAGMGGKLMVQILDDALNNGFKFKNLVLEPNIGEPGVRKWLIEHQYRILTEDLIAEAGHTYELIKARLGEERESLTEKELYFGPFILKEKNPVFYQKWQGQLVYHEKLLTNLNKAKKKDHNRIKQIEKELDFIKEELND